MKKIYKKISMMLLLVFSLQIIVPNSILVSANDNVQQRAYDVYSKKCVQDFSMSKSMVSISPEQAGNGLPAKYKNVSFTLRMEGSIEYDKTTQKYISASSPSVSVRSNSDIVLNLSPVSTWYKDNGTSITFYVSGTLTGKVNMGSTIIPCTINYGTISKQFTVNK